MNRKIREALADMLTADIVWVDDHELARQVHEAAADWLAANPGATSAIWPGQRILGVQIERKTNPLTERVQSRVGFRTLPVTR